MSGLLGILAGALVCSAGLEWHWRRVKRRWAREDAEWAERAGRVLDRYLP